MQILCTGRKQSYMKTDMKKEFDVKELLNAEHWNNLPSVWEGEMKTAQEVVDLINSGRGSEVGFFGEGRASLNEKGEVEIEVATSPVSGDSPSWPIFSKNIWK